MTSETRLSMPLDNRLVLIGGSSHPELTAAVAEELQTPLPAVELGTFANGERRVKIQDAPKAVGGADVFVLQTHGGDMGVDQAIWEQGTLIQAAQMAGAKRITAVCANLGYARQDKRVPGEALGARLVMNFLQSAGARRLLTIDLHAPQIQGLFDGPVDQLEAWPVLVPYLTRRFNTQEMVVVSPDAGRAETASHYGEDLSAPVAVIHKARDQSVANSSRSLEVVGSVNGKDCLLIDDLIDTGGTIVHGARRLKEEGAGDIWVVATHGVFSGDAICRLGDHAISGVIVTDTLPAVHPLDCSPEHSHAEVNRVTIAPLLAGAIREIYFNGSVSTLLQKPASQAKVVHG